MMAEYYGGRFVDHYGEVPNNAWIETLEKLSTKDIDRGYDRMKDSDKYLDWPPTPLAFAALSKPMAEDVGLPDKETAFQMAIGSLGRKHQAVSETLSRMGNQAYTVRHGNEKESRSLFLKAYQVTIDQAAAGNYLPAHDGESEVTTVARKTQKYYENKAEFMNWAKREFLDE